MSDIGMERVRGLLRVPDTAWIDEGDLERHILPQALRWLKRKVNPDALADDIRETALDAGAWYAIHLILLAEPAHINLATADLRVEGAQRITPETALWKAHELLSEIGVATSTPAVLKIGGE